MQCPYPVTIKNPAIEQHGGILLGVQSDGSYLFEDGELVPPTISVPCEHCIICQNRRRDEWAARMELESLDHVCSFFVTLTYNEDYVPPFLCKRDLTNFFKRFRKIEPFRYFACGEYGSDSLTQRPHFHVIMWFDKLFSKLDIEAMLSRTWKFGFFCVDETTRNRMRYVAKYTVKSVVEIPDGYPSPYAVMSRNPGIAGSWFDSNCKFFHEYLALPSGHREQLPRYFMNKLQDVEQIQIKRHRREHAELAPQLSETDKFLRLKNLERSLYRSYRLKYGK